MPRAATSSSSQSPGQLRVRSHSHIRFQLQFQFQFCRISIHLTHLNGIFSVCVCRELLCVCVFSVCVFVCGKQMKMRVPRNIKFKFTFMAANESTNKVPAPAPVPLPLPPNHTHNAAFPSPPSCTLTGIVSKSLSVSRLQQPQQQQQQLKSELKQELEPGARITIATSESCPLFVILFYFRLNACAKVRTDKGGEGRVGSLVRREFKAKLWLHKILRPS